MTTPPPNADELVSAYLDGEAAPDEVAQVEAHPELLARVEAMRAVSEQLAVFPEAPAQQRETHIAAALDAFDDLMRDDPIARDASDSAVDVQAPATTVTSLDAARQRRRPRRINALAAAAAAIVVVFIGATVFSLSTGSNSSDLADDASAESSDDSAADDVADEADFSRAVVAAEAPPAPADLEMGESVADSLGAAAVDEAMDEDTDDAPEQEGLAVDAAAAGPAEAGSDGAADLPAAAADDADGSTAENRLIPSEIEASALYLGQATSLGDLAGMLELRQFVEPEIFDFETCQGSFADLEESDVPTLLGVAILDARFVEIHQVPDVTTQLIIDRQTCTIVDELSP